MVKIQNAIKAINNSKKCYKEAKEKQLKKQLNSQEFSNNKICHFSMKKEELSPIESAVKNLIYIDQQKSNYFQNDSELYESKVNNRELEISDILQKGFSKEIQSSFEVLRRHCFLSFENEKGIKKSILGKIFYRALNLSLAGRKDLENLENDFKIMEDFVSFVNIKNIKGKLFRILGTLLCYSGVVSKFFNQRIVLQIVKFDILSNIFKKIRLKLINEIIKNPLFDQILDPDIISKTILKKVQSARKSIRRKTTKRNSKAKDDKEHNENFYSQSKNIKYEKAFKKLEGNDEVLEMNRNQLHDWDNPDFDEFENLDNIDLQFDLEMDKIALEFEDLRTEDVNCREEFIRETKKKIDYQSESDRNKVQLERFVYLENGEYSNEIRELTSTIYRPVTNYMSNLIKNNEDLIPKFYNSVYKGKIVEQQSSFIIDFKKRIENTEINDQTRKILKLLRKSKKLIEKNLKKYQKVKSLINQVFERILVNLGYSTVGQKCFNSIDIFSVEENQMVSVTKKLIQNLFNLLETKALFSLEFYLEDLKDFVQSLSHLFKKYMEDFSFGIFLNFFFHITH